MEQKHTSRREFLRLGAVTALASACGSCSLSRSRRPDATAEVKDQAVRLSQADSATLLKAEGSLLVQPQGVSHKILVIHPKVGALAAVSARCTHMGCDVQYDPNSGSITCPCHNSVFGVDGRVVKGPAKQALETYRVGVRDGVVTISLGR